MKKTTLFAILITASLASTMVAQAADFSPINKKTPPQGQVQTNKVKVDTKVPVPTTATTPVPAVPPVTTPAAPAPTTPVVTPVPVPTVPPVVTTTPQPPTVPGTTPKVPATPHTSDAKGKVTINHKGRVMTVDERSLKGHLAHGDTVVSGGNNHESDKDKDKDKGKGKGKGKGKNKGNE